MTHVFRRVLTRELPHAAQAEGAWITDTDGKKYLDGAGGAIVSNVGHGDPVLLAAMTEQASKVQYVHGTMFTTDALEAYAEDVASVLPMEGAMLYPVSGGSEAVETALKLARTYQIARGEDSRHVVIGRKQSYHGNTFGALDVGGKDALKGPYRPWLGRFRHTETPYEYRCSMTEHPVDCGVHYAEALEALILEIGPENVAAFIAEPVGGATLGATVPTDDYWPAIVEVCHRHGVLVIADEVMTGFGRTGRWFGVDHWGVKPDILTAGKGSTSGYWPFGFAAASAGIYETVKPKGFVHGFTWSHNGVGAAVAHATLRRLREGDLVEASRVKGELLLKELSAALGDHRYVGDVRGIGLMVGVEPVADRDTKAPFPRSEKVTESILAAARERGLLLYSSTGHVDGRDGDLVMFGPPLILSDDERAFAVRTTADAIAASLG